MSTYVGNSSEFHNSLYIYSTDDLVLGGSEGTSNIPIKELADNSAYIKKFKGYLLKGSGEPTSAVLSGISIDDDILTNCLYLDELTGAFWRPEDKNGNSWYNIYKYATLNIQGLKINDAGNDEKYFFFQYNSSTNVLELTDQNGNLASVRVGKVSFNSVDGNNLTVSRIADDEILLLFDIEAESENGDALFSAKRLFDIAGVTITGFEKNDDPGITDKWFTSSSLVGQITGNDFVQIRGIDEDTGDLINGFYRVNVVAAGYFTTHRNFNAIISTSDQPSGLSGNISKDNSASVKWDEVNNRFELTDRSGNLLPLNVAGFSIDDNPVNFIADRVITTQAQFNVLFKDNLQTGDDTVYLKTPESGYVDTLENEYIYLKANADEVDGHYDLDNWVSIIGDNVKIECAPSVKILLGSTAGFKTKNDSNIEVLSYNKTGKELTFLSTDSYYTNGEMDGQQISLLSGDSIFTYSETPEANEEYIIDTIEKGITETNKDLDLVSLASSYLISTAKYGDKVYYAYINAGEDIVIRSYTYNSGTNTYDLDSDYYIDSSNNYKRISIAVDANYIYVVSYTNELRYAIKDKTPTGTEAFTTSQIIANDYFNYNLKVIVDNSKLYLIVYNSNASKLQLLKYDGSWSGLSDIYNGTPDTYNYDIAINGTIIAASYCEGDELNVKYSNTGTISFGSAFTPSISNSGYFSRIIASDNQTGSEEFYITFNGNIDTGLDNDTVYFSKLDTSTGFINVTELYQSLDCTFDTLDIIINENNQYASSMNLIQILATNNLPSTGSNDLYSFVYNTNTDTWSMSELGGLASNNKHQVFLFNCLNDYIFFVYLIDNTSAETNYISRMEYYFKIIANIEISDRSMRGNVINTMVISHNHNESINLILNIDGDSVQRDSILKLGNNNNCEHKIKLYNCLMGNVGDKALDYENKVFNNSLELMVSNGDSNKIKNIVSQLNHSVINNSRIEHDEDTGFDNKIFNDCNNINVIGIVDQESFIGSGNFDE